MNITIMGYGVYGKALAGVFLEKETNKVSVWNKFEHEFDEKYLNISFTTNLSSAVKDADLIVIAIPVAFLDETIISLKEVYEGQDILIASKGIDIDSRLFAYQIIEKHLGNVPVGVISGGTFAGDMVNKKVMGITLGTKYDSIKDKIKTSFETNYLKVQYIDDIVGVSVCGSIKNVMAIGFGMLDGASFPPSSRFLFLTKAIYEIRDLIEALGGDEDTVMTYAGIDDIMMTCTSSQSRNYSFGNLIGKNSTKEEIEDYKNKTTIEGLGTSEAIYRLAKDKNIKLPLSEVIYKILYEDNDISELIKVLEKNS